MGGPKIDLVLPNLVLISTLISLNKESRLLFFRIWSPSSFIDFLDPRLFHLHTYLKILPPRCPKIPPCSLIGKIHCYRVCFDENDSFKTQIWIPYMPIVHTRPRVNKALKQWLCHNFNFLFICIFRFC